MSKELARLPEKVDYIAQTLDKRNISYTDDDPESVKRRAEYAGLKVIRVITLAEYEEGKVSA